MSDRENYWQSVNDELQDRLDTLHRFREEDFGRVSCEVLPGPCYEPDPDLDEQVYPGAGGD